MDFPGRGYQGRGEGYGNGRRGKERAGVIDGVAQKQGRGCDVGKTGKEA